MQWIRPRVTVERVEATVRMRYNPVMVSAEPHCHWLRKRHRVEVAPLVLTQVEQELAGSTMMSLPVPCFLLKTKLNLRSTKYTLSGLAMNYESK